MPVVGNRENERERERERERAQKREGLLFKVRRDDGRR
jgi:hypothetical protein